MEQFDVLAFATQGNNGDDERRLQQLLSRVRTSFFPIERVKKRQTFWALLRYIVRERPKLVVMEGTGLFGGLALLIGSRFGKVPYVISSGDAVGPYIASKHPMLGPLFHWYERRLYRNAIGFIGWSPYLTGRALTYGTKFAMTAPGWAPSALTDAQHDEARADIRTQYGIPNEQIVIGIVGSLNWNKRVGYCYGYELVKAVLSVKRQDITVLIVGDGDGKSKLEQLAMQAGANRVIFTGRVLREEVPKYMSAMDLASLPQSIDQVGSFRYTTKVSEYLAAALPIVMGKTPMSYDLNGDWIYRIQGNKPWEPAYIAALGELLEQITLEDIQQRRHKVPKHSPVFNKEVQIHNVSDFIQDILLEVKR
ncbi:MAG: glycosyltransferase [Candidatus Cohnella colombiensis]|uniref:Glycosyltransferase n=1 Tax=Candidatus Cohnella colombiensis TaxID=3121368 RepID=A0AA95JDG2_9BACL|nr:MAG: glycosyltransferase [Cohnella sp.]